MGTLVGRLSWDAEAVEEHLRDGRPRSESHGNVVMVDDLERESKLARGLFDAF